MAEAISNHKLMAMGKPMESGDFGVEKLASVQGKAHTPKAGHLADHERAAPPPIGGHQANPRHGNHRE